MSDQNNEDEPVKLDDGFTISKLDMVYPPMKWTSKFSTGENMPFAEGMSVQDKMIFMAAGIDMPSHYPAGLWLFSDNFPRTHMPEYTSGPEGVVVEAYTGAHAQYLFRKLHPPTIEKPF